VLFNSKAMKKGFEDRFEDEDPESSHGPIRKLLYKVNHFIKWEILYKIENFFHIHKERFGRMIAWARFVQYSYDFDAHTLYDIIAFKLIRVYAALSDGNAIQENEDMNALKEAISVCERLSKDTYNRKYLEEHDKKWGKLEEETIPQPDKDGGVRSYLMNMWRNNANTPELEQLERKEFVICYENGEIDRKADIDKLAEIFKNHLARWWD